MFNLSGSVLAVVLSRASCFSEQICPSSFHVPFTSDSLVLFWTSRSIPSLKKRSGLIKGWKLRKWRQDILRDTLVLLLRKNSRFLLLFLLLLSMKRNKLWVGRPIIMGPFGIAPFLKLFPNKNWRHLPSIVGKWMIPGPRKGFLYVRTEKVGSCSFLLVVFGWLQTRLSD